MIQMRSDEAFEVIKEACAYAKSSTFYSSYFEITKNNKLEKALEIMEKIFKLYKNRWEETK